MKWEILECIATCHMLLRPRGVYQQERMIPLSIPTCIPSSIIPCPYILLLKASCPTVLTRPALPEGCSVFSTWSYVNLNSFWLNKSVIFIRICCPCCVSGFQLSEPWCKCVIVYFIFILCSAVPLAVDFFLLPCLYFVFCYKITWLSHKYNSTCTYVQATEY
jgi:hypothetical protein